jgi:hypothetical protein
MLKILFCVWAWFTKRLTATELVFVGMDNLLATLAIRVAMAQGSLPSAGKAHGCGMAK